MPPKPINSVSSLAQDNGSEQGGPPAKRQKSTRHSDQSTSVVHAVEDTDSGHETANGDAETLRHSVKTKGKGVAKASNHSAQAVDSSTDNATPQDVNAADSDGDRTNNPPTATDAKSKDENDTGATGSTAATGKAKPSVQLALKKTPASRGAVIENPGWIPDTVFKRLVHAASISTPEKFRYALATVNPNDVYWGGSGRTFLCYRGRVLTVTFVARVVSTFFKIGAERTAPACASVKFKFLSKQDLASARSLVYAKSKPPTETSKTTFWAGKKCTIYDKLEEHKINFFFDQLYDATEWIGPRSKMEKIDDLNLRCNDTALMECRVNRYMPGDKKDYSWPLWKATFDLCSIKKMWASSTDIADDEESEEEIMTRVDTDDEFEGY